MGEQMGGWRKVGSYGKCRSVYDADGNFLRSEYRDIVRRGTSAAKLTESTAEPFPERVLLDPPRPVRLAGGCTLYQLPGTVRMRRQPART